MKFKKLFLGMLSVGVLSACSNDLPVEDGKVLENETTTYVKLSLVSPGSGTRAAEYENGSADESMVQNILLTFFDAGRNYVGQHEIVVNEKVEGLDVPGGPNTVERFLTVVAPITLPENVNHPKYIVAYVNPTSDHKDLSTSKLEDNIAIIRNRASVSEAGYRTMNNSVYFNEQSGNTRYATEVNFTTQFYKTEKEAKDPNANSIEITVERMEAKVKLNNDLSKIEVRPYTNAYNGQSSTDEKKFQLEFMPQAWFVNATEKRSFLIKNFRTGSSNIFSGNYPETDFGMKFNDLKNAFKTGLDNDVRHTEVNDETNLRSYWALDPTYFEQAGTTGSTDLYPDVSYDVQYGQINTSGKENYPLLYRSYANVMAEQTKGESTNYVKFNSKVKTHEYVLENTMNRQTLIGNDAMASMSSVVLIGYYVIKDESGEIKFDGSSEKGNFYIRHESSDTKHIMLSDNDVIDYFLERAGSTLYVQTVDQEGNKVKDSYEPLRAKHLQNEHYKVSYDNFDLVYPEKSLVAPARPLSEQWRTMMLSKGEDGTYGDILIYDANSDSGNGGYKQITEADIKDLKTRLYSTFGVVEKFQTGKAYFNVPLRHIWGTSNKFDSQKVQLGDYGVVRNHVYDLTINKIEGLGTGIGDIEQPIVPPTGNDQYYISAKLRILQWRVVKQSVDL